MITVARCLIAIALTGLAHVALAVPPSDPCTAQDETAGAVAALPHVGDALQPGRTLRILAVGSATMFGPEASLAPGTLTSQALGTSKSPAPPQQFTQDASEHSFPRRMAEGLRNAVPGASVQVVVRGGRGLLATDMLVILRDELKAAAIKYDMVIWQTGTVEAVRNLPPGEFAQTLLDGAETVRDAGADLILVDPQFSRFLQTNANLEPYTQALVQVAAMPGVVLFRRYDLMRSWVNDGQIDLERTNRTERKKTVETLHACLGQHLARLVLESARS